MDKDLIIVREITKNNATKYYEDLINKRSKIALRIDHLTLLNDLHILRALQGAKNYFAGLYKRTYFIGLKHANQTKEESYKNDLKFLNNLIRYLRNNI